MAKVNNARPLEGSPEFPALGNFLRPVPITAESSSGDRHPVGTGLRSFLKAEPQSFERQTLRYPGGPNSQCCVVQLNSGFRLEDRFHASQNRRSPGILVVRR
jgi:hypothetical protein